MSKKNQGETVEDNSAVSPTPTEPTPTEDEKWLAADELAKVIFDQYEEAQVVYITIEPQAFWTEQLADSLGQPWREYKRS
jgi:hypothetical protein